MTSEAPIYIEACPLMPRRLTGIGRFVVRLVEALARQAPIRLLTAIPSLELPEKFPSVAWRCGQEICLPDERLPEVDADLAGWVRALFQQPRRKHDPRRAGRATGVYTWMRPAYRHFKRELNIVYDFTPLILPHTHTEATKDHFGAHCTECAGLADKTVAISASTQADAVWLCDLPKKDVVVGYPGPSICVRQHAHPGPVERDPHLCLVVATLEPRKNARFLVEWFLNSSALDPQTELWWVGPRGWLYDEARPKGLCGRERTIKFLGMVSDRRLCELYRRAAFTVYPSLYEGFGFPVLDALRHGTPVLCSYNSSLKEFEGPGVFYFDPCDPETLDAAYGELRAAGSFARADLDERFSWDTLARTVVSLARA